MKYMRIDTIIALIFSLLGAGTLIGVARQMAIRPAPHTITPQQIEADYAGRMFLQGRINSIDEDELELMSPAIREAVNQKL